MAATRQRGCEGVIRVKVVGASGAAAQFFGVENWEFTETSDREEASEIGACAKTYVPGAVETNGVINFWHDHSATANQDLAVVAGSMDLEIYPAGVTTGKRIWKSPSGGALILEVGRNAGTQGAVGSRFNFTVSGAMVATSVP